MSEKNKSSGGLWKRSGQYGEYMSGQIEIAGVKHNFKAYPNRYKQEGDKRPEYSVFLDKPRDEPKQEIVEDDLPF